MMLDHSKIGNQIALLRKERGLTGEKFAELLGVSAQAVSKWENGKCLPETALLPLIAEILAISIDSLLVPRELILLNAVYTDGDKTIDVTQILNKHINGNKIDIIVNAQYLGELFDSTRIAVLILKYQLPSGTYYAYALQNNELKIDLSVTAFSIDTEFKVIDGYYGNINQYCSAVQKLNHYDYFKWKAIHINHENFPSSPNNDDVEYLTIIYLNSAGIHVISAEEGATICYSDNKTELFLKDTSTCILPNVITLEWEKVMDCTWAGAIYAALKYMGETYTYEQIMGMSGACYRIAFTEVWDWSAVDALVAFDYSTVLFKAIGYEQVWASRIDKEQRSIERKNIMQDISNGKPVVAINLRIAPEWGVITGYKEEGKVLLCRTYFDKEILNENIDYLETDFWPFLITHFGEKKEKHSDYQILIDSLATLVDSFNAPIQRGYYQGAQAYQKWIEGLRNNSLWNENNSKEDIDRRIMVNDYLLLNLIDARRCAATYLNSAVTLLENGKSERLLEVSNMYAQITTKLKTFREKSKQTDAEDLKYNLIFTKANKSNLFRGELAELLENILIIEKNIIDKVRLILNS